MEGTGPAGAAPAPSDQTPSYKDPGASPAAEESLEVNAMAGPAASAAPEPDEDPSAARDTVTSSPPPVLLPLLSVAFTVVGVVLGGLWLAGRTVRSRG
jgi:hypothetical protein